MTDKRTHERSPIELAASYGIAADADIYNEALIKNISQGGFAFHSKENIKMGKELILAFEISETEDIDLKVKVVWSTQNYDTEDFSIGVEIINTDTEQYKQFLNFYNSEF